MITTILSSESLVIGSVLDLTLCKVQIEESKPAPSAWRSWRSMRFAYRGRILKEAEVFLEKYIPCAILDASLVILEHTTCPMGFKVQAQDPLGSVQFNRIP